MKSVRTICFAAVVMLLAGSPALALVEFKDGLTHDIGYAIDDEVRVDWQTPSMYTTVNVLPGANLGFFPISLQGFEQSRMNISGGWTRLLNAYDSSQVSVSGGSIGLIHAYGTSQVSITGGSIRWYLYAHDSSRMYITGGSIGDGSPSNGHVTTYGSSQLFITSGWIGGSLYLHNSSQVSITGGSVRGRLIAWDSPQASISGGLIQGDLTPGGSSQVSITGGTIRGPLQPFAQGLINIYGSNFAVDGRAVGNIELTSIYGDWYWYEPVRHLTGTLDSGEPINNDFYIGHSAKIVLIGPETEIIVGIDIKPGSYPNSINPDSQGVIPVAILTTSTEAGEPVTFDASTVVAQTVRFGPAEAAAAQWALEDVDDDGDVDMILHFRTQETGIVAGTTEAILTGETIEGENIIGTDSVRTVPPEDKGKK